MSATPASTIMPTSLQAHAYLPPPPRAAGRSMVLSVLVHGLLVLALTWGLNWNQHQVALSFEAEMWSAIPAPAAPKATPEPDPKPQAQPEPRVQAPPPSPPPAQNIKAEQAARDAELAIAKQRIQEQEKARQAEAERQAAKRRAELERKEAEHQAKVKQLEAERQRKAEKAEQAIKKQQEDNQKRKDQEAKAKREAEENRKLEDQRKANLARLNALAGTSSDPQSTGTQAKASGPSDSWAGRIQGAVLPRITFTDDKPGSIVASVKVQLAPDGTIVGSELIKSSGNKAWDEAVMRALEKTGKLPRDTDGRIHSPVVIDFNPRALQR